MKKVDIRSLILNILIVCLYILSIYYLFNCILKSESFSMIDYILLFIVICYISITVHEVAHSLAYIFHRMRIRAIYIYPFCFIKNKNNWKTLINFNCVGLMGASVVDLFEINNDDDFKRVTEAFANSMLCATISGIIMSILGLVLIIIGYVAGENKSLVDVGGLLFAINFVLVINCFARSGNVGGDYFAYKYMFKNNEISAQFIFNYIKLSSNYNEIRRNNTYLRKMLIKIFERKVEEDITNIDAISIATGFISDFLAAKIDLPESIKIYLKDFYRNTDKFSKVKNIEIYKKFITRVACYYEFIGKHEIAEKLYNDLIINFPKGEVDNYYKLQAEQIILHKDNYAILSDRKNIKPDTFYTFYRLFDGYISDEVYINGLRNSK